MSVFPALFEDRNQQLGVGYPRFLRRRIRALGAENRDKCQKIARCLPRFWPRPR